MATTIIDLHTHTRWGSQCAYMTPDELVQRAKAIGLNGVCITEHNQLWSPEAIESLSRRHGFLVIGGVEVSTDVGEILVFGLHESVVRVYDSRELREMVDRANGAMVAAHPFRGLAVPSPSNSEHGLSVEDGMRRPVFSVVEAIEVYNGMAGHWEQRFAGEVSARLKLGGTGGSDAHAVLGVGSGVTIFDGEIRSEEDLVAALRVGQFRGADGRRLPELRLRG
jgi:hypothetical protein